MRSDFDATLDRCLADLAAGASLDTCLARHPDHAAELRPLLELAVDLQYVTTPRAADGARAEGRQRVLAAAAARLEQRPSFATWWRRAVLALRVPVWRPAAALALVLLVATAAFLLVASTSSLPGDAFYPVKLARQAVQLAFTFDPLKERILADQFATERRYDVGAALSMGRTATVHFEGILESIDEDRWLVSGLPVVVSDATRIDGEPYRGAPVDVRGELSGAGNVRALSVFVDPDHAPWPEMTGTATSTPTPTASLPPRTAAPTATARPPATLTAPLPPSTPTGTATPTITPTPVRTDEPGGPAGATASTTATPLVISSPLPATGEPTATRQPTEPVETPSPPGPTDTPQPTRTPLPSVTRQPTNTPRPTETPLPTDTPPPSATPQPTEKSDPGETPEPADTARPTETPEPTNTPKLTKTPEPTETPKPGDDDGSGRAACKKQGVATARRRA
ncbi:MAG TPA: hypothetical protein VLC95_20345 [Anaerolineae bacterium]|nr:hypothetical protein [Anaerolineae bacterium]